MINTAFAWESTAGHVWVPEWRVPLVAGPSVIGGTLSMLVVLPLTTSMICTLGIRSYQRGGLRVLRADALPPAVRSLMVGPVRRGLRLAAGSVAAFGPVTILAGSTLLGHGVSRSAYVASQAIAGVLLGAMVTPVAAMAAMAEPAGASG